VIISLFKDLGELTMWLLKNHLQNFKQNEILKSKLKVA